MARRAQPLQPVEYAVLGLLRLAPRHGYELASHFAPDAEVGAALPVDLSDLYAALKRLEVRGLVAGQVEVHGARPPRHVYHLTTDGEDELRRWLDQPVRRNREVRLDFALKLYFARLLPQHDAPALVAAQLTASREQLARLEAELPAEPGGFARLMGELRLVATRGTIEWLERGAAPSAAAPRGVASSLGRRDAAAPAREVRG